MESNIPKVQVLVGPEFPKKVIPLIESSKTSIDIIVFDWRWYPQDPGSTVQLFNQAIVRASRRKVKVQVLSQSPSIIPILKNLGIDAKKLQSRKLLHCKIMIIDKKILVTGSHNYSHSAFSTNYETSLIVEGASIVDRFNNFFNNLFF